MKKKKERRELGIYTEKGINRSRKEEDEHLGRVSTYPRGEKKVSDHFPSYTYTEGDSERERRRKRKGRER